MPRYFKAEEFSTALHAIPMGQYGPTRHGSRGIYGSRGDVFSISYVESIYASASIPSSHPNTISTRPQILQ
jgi:hypothetical protein